MFSVKKNNITLTRGDSFVAQLTLTLDDEETPYIPVEGDTIRFYMKHNVLNASKTEYADAEPLITKVIPNDTLLLELESADTKPYGFGEYAYNIEMTFADGFVDTFIKGILKLTEEVD